jgi:hypothetical protein
VALVTRASEDHGECVGEGFVDRDAPVRWYSVRRWGLTNTMVLRLSLASRSGGGGARNTSVCRVSSVGVLQQLIIEGVEAEPARSKLPMTTR